MEVGNQTVDGMCSGRISNHISKTEQNGREMEPPTIRGSSTNVENVTIRKLRDETPKYNRRQYPTLSNVLISISRSCLYDTPVIQSSLLELHNKCEISEKKGLISTRIELVK